MRDSISIGPVPSDEQCEQLGRNYDHVRARQECRRFRDLLLKKFGDPPDGAAFVIRSNPHDFGSYMDVAVEYESTTSDAVKFALFVEEHAPDTWDDVTPVRMAREDDPEGSANSDQINGYPYI